MASSAGTESSIGTYVYKMRDVLNSKPVSYTHLYKAIKKSELTIQTYIDDGHALTKYLKEKFSEEKIYIVG